MEFSYNIRLNYASIIKDYEDYEMFSCLISDQIIINIILASFINNWIWCLQTDSTCGQKGSFRGILEAETIPVWTLSV